MSRKTRFLLAVLLVGAFLAYRHFMPSREATRADARASHTATAPAPLRRWGALAFKPCSLASPLSGNTLEAQCTTLRVPEDRSVRGGRTIALNIAWLPATDDGDVATDPVFFLAGGPGQSAVDTYPALDPVFAEVRKHRHVVLVDQRGTGKSNLLACKDDAQDRVANASAADAVGATERCRDTLGKRADLRRYTTTEAVADLEAVRRAIGAASIDLVGVSYGTRVAQQYAMRHPRSTRAIVLDSVVPNTLTLGNIFARNLDDALALQFARCRQAPACRAKVGDPRRELDTLLATLRSAPPLVRYRDATTGQSREERLLPEHVMGLVRMYAYLPQAASLPPVLVHDANRGHYEELMALAQMLTGELEDAMAMGMQLSVICSEDGDGIVARPEDAATVLGNALTDVMAAQCKAWPRGTVPADFHAPLSTPVPALVLSGEFDPVTPPRYGDAVAKTLPNGRHLVLRGQGHNVIGAGCMPKLFARFIETADAKALDAKCLARLPYTPPFTSFNGWEP